MKRLISATAVVLSICVCVSEVRADSVPARVLLGSRNLVLTPQPVFDGKRVLAPLSILDHLGANYVVAADTKRVTVITASARSTDIATTQVAGAAMLPMDRLAALVGAEAKWDTDSGALTLLAGVESVEFADNVLKVNCTFPVTCKADDFGGKVWVDIEGAVVGTEAHEVYVGSPLVERARLGQHSETTARVVLDLNRSVGYRIEGPQPSSCIRLRVAEDLPKGEAKQPALLQPFVISDVRVESVGAERFNVIVSTTNRARAVVDYGAAPPQIVLRLPGGTLADTFAGPTGAHPLLTGVKVKSPQAGSGTRVELDLARILAYELEVSDASVMLGVKLPDKSGGTLADKLVVIDPGHLGGRKGACHGGVREEDVVLAIARQLSSVLQQEGARTVITWTGSDLSLADRSRVAVSNNADLFLSIHCNACPAPNTASGIETYYYENEPGSRQPFAYAVHAAVCRSTGMLDRKTRGANFAVLRELANTGIPGLLLECGYLNHDSDRTKLLSEDYRSKLVAGMIAGLKAYVENVPIVR